jgi:hypothetical protein
MHEQSRYKVIESPTTISAQLDSSDSKAHIMHGDSSSLATSCIRRALATAMSFPGYRT